MKSKFLLLLTFCLSAACSQLSKPKFDPKAEEEVIRAVLNAEQIAWNNGDIDAFMEGFWKSDSLQFVSARGVNHGWEETRQGYKLRYADRAAMGTLSYEILQVTPLASDVFVVMGKYHVTRDIGNLDGAFTVIFKKIKGKWVAIYDHSA